MNSDRLKLPARPRILVIALRRLGDVLLTTPLIASIRKAWPEARIDALVFRGTEGILEGNPDLDGIVVVEPRPSLLESLKVGRGLLRRYDLAISTQSGDRPTAFAVLAGAVRIGVAEPRFGGRLKRLLLHRVRAHVPGAHRVEAILRTVDALGIERVATVVPPRPESPVGLPPGPYAVIHASPLFSYKRWTVRGWRSLADSLTTRRLNLVATGGPSLTERAYLDEIWHGMPVLRLDGRLSWGALAVVLSNASLYVGPDTSVTHLAAATGCPTVALYGPTDPRLWGPWPSDGLAEPWSATGPIQRSGNVWLVQHAFPCTPCQLEGCNRSLSSESECLTQLVPSMVMSAVDEALALTGRSKL